MSGFWASRKAAVEAEAQEEALVVSAQAAAVQEAEMAERTDEDILAELELPDPDTLEQGDDFKVFLSEAVPERIRTRALRRLWRLNPVLANVDGLVDYGEDFNDASFLLENMQTAYQVGKGMTEHVQEMARQAEEADQEIAEPDVLEDDDQDIPEQDDAPELMAEVEAEPMAETPVAFSDEIDETLAYAPSRRMQFAFETPALTPPITPAGASKDAARA